MRREDIDLIDIASPNDTHAEIAIAAAEAGKMVMCEKPLGRSAAETLKMVAAVEAAQRPNMIWYNFSPCPRRHPRQAADRRRKARSRLPLSRQVAAGLDNLCRSAAGRRGPLWRLDAGVAGSGVTGDLLAHCIDTAMWLNGPIDSVNGMTETFVKERTHNLTGKKQEATIDDAAAFLARSPTAHSPLSKRPVTRAATRRNTRSKSTARTPRSHGTCTICIGCNISTTATKGDCAAGARRTSPTVTTRI